MHFSSKGFFFGLVLVAVITTGVLAQDTAATPAASPTPTPAPTPAATPPPSTVNQQIKQDKNTPAAVTAEQVVETTILVYGSRPAMAHIRKTMDETGKLTLNHSDGTSETATYQKRIIRGESVEKERWRIDYKFPSLEYSLILNNKIFGVLGGSVFQPRAESISGFEAQIYHNLETLLRYKENGSTIELQKDKHKALGVEFYVIDVTDKQQRKTRFYISVKSFRIMALDYVANSTKYTRKFYDYRIAQGTMVPYRSVLFNGDIQLEECLISTIRYGQKVEEGFFDEN